MTDASIEPGHVRRNALRKAAAATVAAIVMIFALLMLEERQDAITVTATEPDPPALMTSETAPDATTASATASETVPSEPATPLPAPALASAEAAAAITSAAGPTPAEAAAEATGPAAAAKVPAPLPDGYLVQLGVFGAMDNAEALHADIVARGLPTRIEGRVVVGPFPTKAAATAAQERLRREGLGTGFVVPPRKGK